MIWNFAKKKSKVVSEVAYFVGIPESLKNLNRGGFVSEGFNKIFMETSISLVTRINSAMIVVLFISVQN